MSGLDFCFLLQAAYCIVHLRLAADYQRPGAQHLQKKHGMGRKDPADMVAAC